MVIVCVQWYKVVVLFVDIGEIFDHHCLNFLVTVTQEVNEKRIDSRALDAQQTRKNKIHQNC